MTILIGLHGRRGAGKDAAFDAIHSWAAERGIRAARRGFADYLKLSFARLFIPTMSLQEAVQWCDELKTEESLSQLSIQWQRGDAQQTRTAIIHQLTGRQALQRYGTEAHRDTFGTDFWVDALLPVPDTQFVKPHGINGEPITKDTPLDEVVIAEESGRDWRMEFAGPAFESFGPMDPPEIAVITDCRFENEAQRIKLLGGDIIRVLRDTGTYDTHASEAGLPDELVDVNLVNDSTLEHWHMNVSNHMTAEYHTRLIKPVDAAIVEDRGFDSFETGDPA